MAAATPLQGEKQGNLLLAVLPPLQQAPGGRPGGLDAIAAFEPFDPAAVGWKPWAGAGRSEGSSWLGVGSRLVAGWKASGLQRRR
jgi:hypothetical protein